MSFLQVVLAFLIVLGPLVAIHEFGHFWVARRVGVKVMTFSIGFGPAFLKWKDKLGTQYQLAAIPLGGYVRMADEREGEVAPEDLPRAFNRQPVWARMAIVAAGPLIGGLFIVRCRSDPPRSTISRRKASIDGIAGRKAGCVPPHAADAARVPAPATDDSPTRRVAG